MSAWTDAHCHLQDEFFDEGADTPTEVSATLQRAYDAGVDRVVIVGTGGASSYEALELTTLESPVELYATVGLHAHDAKDDLAPSSSSQRRATIASSPLASAGSTTTTNIRPETSNAKPFRPRSPRKGARSRARGACARGVRRPLCDLSQRGRAASHVIHCFTGTPSEAEMSRTGCDISISASSPSRTRTSFVLLQAGATRSTSRRNRQSILGARTESRREERARLGRSVVGRDVAQLQGEEVEAVRTATSANSARLFNI